MVLDHAVLHDLDRGRAEPAVRVLLTSLDQLVDLFGATAALPPEGGHHPRGESSACVELPVGREVSHAVGFAGVLEGRDAQAVQILQRILQACLPLLVSDLGHVHEIHRALLERADGLSRVRIAVDAPIRRIGRVTGDPGNLERLRVQPRAVPVRRRQMHRAIRDDSVDQPPIRNPRGERSHRPAASVDPGGFRVPLRAARDRLHILRCCLVVAEIAETGGLHAPVDRVDVAILEGGQHGTPTELDDARTFPDERLHAGLAPHVGQHAVANRKRPSPGPCRVYRVDRTAAQHDVRGGCFARQGVGCPRGVALTGRDQHRRNE